MQIFDKPSEMSLNTNLWVASAVLAGLRKATNDPNRATRRDRGETKNILNDLQGAIGELIALKFLEYKFDCRIKHNLLSLDGHVDDVDFILHHESGELRLEAKCLLLEPNKRYFLINEKAHNNSRERGAHGYLPIITSVAATVAQVGRLISVESIETWEVHDFGYGDPARRKRLSDVAVVYFDSSENALRSNLPPLENLLERSFDEGALSLGYARETDFNLSERDFDEVLAALTGLIA